MSWFELQEPLLTLTLRHASPELLPDLVVQVQAGGVEGAAEHYFRIKGSPFVYKANRQFYLDFLHPADHFRDRLLFRDRSEADLKILKVRRVGGKTEVLERSAAEWKSAPAAALRKTLLGLQVLAFEAIDSETIHLAGLDAPQADIEIEFTDGERARVSLGKEITGESDEEGRPRWIGIQGKDGILRPAILGAVGAAELAPMLDDSARSR
jgi:hypothetical protein